MIGRHFRYPLTLALGAIGALAATVPAEQGHFRTTTNVVLIGATVVDRHNRLIRGLQRDDFQLFEDKVAQTIRYFGEEDVPLSLAVVFDTSGSMEGKVASMRKALAAVLETSNPEDEFCLITVADRPETAVSWTRDPAEIQNRAFSKLPHGRTALLDAVQAGVRQIQKSRNPRRALVVFSDGGDNYSRISEKALLKWLEEVDVQLYAIDTSDLLAAHDLSPEEASGQNLLQELCDRAGGRYFQLDGPRDSEAVAERVGNELRSQYVLGYVPSGQREDGKFHHLQLKIPRRAGSSRLSVYWRRGYRAPTD